MTATTHTRSIHIDAPVGTVFDYVKDPSNYPAAFPEGDGTTLKDITRNPDGEVSKYTLQGKVLFFNMHWTMTREEQVANERVMDHSNTGGRIAFDLEPESTGTKLTMSFTWSSLVPLADKVVDRFSWNGDRDLDAMLANVKKAIEA